MTEPIQEIISKVEILPSGELILILKSGGEAAYQYIYREAAGVYWDKDLKGFKSTIPKTKSYKEWFYHILKVVDEPCCSLQLNDETNWVNIPNEIKEQILSGDNP